VLQAAFGAARGFSMCSKRKRSQKMQMLKHFFINLAKFILRLIFILWIVGVIDIFSPSGEINRIEICSFVVMSFVLHLTKLDVKLIAKFIMKWQFKAIVHMVYFMLWVAVLFKFSLSMGHERGLWLMMAKLIIAPISELLFSILYLLTSLVYRVDITLGTPLFYVKLVLSIIFSFIVLELLLRLAENCLNKKPSYIKDELKT
jgi:hypothetical protein